MYMYIFFSRRNQHRARELCQRVIGSRMAPGSGGTAASSALYGALGVTLGAIWNRKSEPEHRYPDTCGFGHRIEFQICSNNCKMAPSWAPFWQNVPGLQESPSAQKKKNNKVPNMAHKS